jgi:DNA-directed RNA polymerase subunit RPC12/RpoP
MVPPPSTSFNDQIFEQLVQEGIAAVKGGNRQQARQLLNRAVSINRSDARVWIWLSATTDEPEEQRGYLEQAVAADPSNATARRGLVMLSEKLDKTRLMAEGASVAPPTPGAQTEAGGQPYHCPHCGGRLVYDTEETQLECEHCGYIQDSNPTLANGNSEQVMDFVLPTTRAHRWAASQQRVACEACGAVTLLPPGQTADRCPYCGSNRFVSSPELAELIDPQGICLMQVDAKQAAQQAEQWLSRGWLSPDNLANSKVTLHPAYYPFWTFSGTLELPWSCEVNEGSSKYPNWVPRSGSEFEFFDEILVAGIRSMSSEETKSIEPFDLKELVEFTPDYLAGWTALTYDYPMSDASLSARERVVRKMNRSLYNLVEPGREKRNLEGRGTKWSGMTFKYVLLPLWVGSYLHKGKTYWVLVNGQTGKTGGSKPTDTSKATLLSAGGILSLIIVLTILYLLWMRFGR